MPGSQTALGRASARTNAPVHIAFRQRNGVGAQDDVDFAAQWLAYAIPYRRFAEVLADNCARLGADVVCYSFTVADSHHLLLADLPAHSVYGLLHAFMFGRTVAFRHAKPGIMYQSVGEAEDFALAWQGCAAKIPLIPWHSAKINHRVYVILLQTEAIESNFPNQRMAAP